MSDKETIRTYLLTTNDIVIVRTNGVIHNSHLVVLLPARLFHQRSNHGPLGFMLEPWVPFELMNGIAVLLDTKNILAEIQISDAMQKFYTSWAAGEVEKQEAFSKIFDKQVQEIEKSYNKRIQASKEHQQKSPRSLDSQLTDALVELFDDIHNEWGDPTVTN